MTKPKLQAGSQSGDAGVLDENLLALLKETGVRRSASDAAIEIDATLQNWRRRVQKREPGLRALRDLKIGVDLAQLDVLVAIEGRQTEFKVEEGAETMVATVAERLNIDPSRASRIISEMVELGYATRAESQSDARRTIIELTEAGKSVVEAVRAYKWVLLGDFLNGWSDADLEAFLPLLLRFTEWSDNLEQRSARFEGLMETLAGSIKPARGR